MGRGLINGTRSDKWDEVFGAPFVGVSWWYGGVHGGRRPLPFPRDTGAGRPGECSSNPKFAPATSPDQGPLGHHSKGPPRPPMRLRSFPGSDRTPATPTS